MIQVDSCDAPRNSAGLGPDHPEGVVDDFFDVFAAHRHARQQPRQALVVVAVQGAKRRLVLGPGDALEQLALGGVGDRGRNGPRD